MAEFFRESGVDVVDEVDELRGFGAAAHAFLFGVKSEGFGVVGAGAAEEEKGVGGEGRDERERAEGFAIERAEVAALGDVEPAFVGEDPMFLEIDAIGADVELREDEDGARGGRDGFVGFGRGRGRGCVDDAEAIGRAGASGRGGRGCFAGVEQRGSEEREQGGVREGHGRGGVYRETTKAAVTSTATLPFSTTEAFSLSLALP